MKRSARVDLLTVYTSRIFLARFQLWDLSKTAGAKISYKHLIVVSTKIFTIFYKRPMYTYLNSTLYFFKRWR